ncbi:MAG: fructose-bisphosphatase class II [Candidatus Margulisiibacteriota bacterium]
MPVIESNGRTLHGFPPTVKMLRSGLAQYRRARGLYDRELLPEVTLRKILIGREFTAGESKFRIQEVHLVPIANPIRRIGDVEMMPDLLIASIAAAVAAHSYLGTGQKDEADGAATQTMRAALSLANMRGIIRGGEGGGRDSMGRAAALYMNEEVGTGYGSRVDILVDPLEVTNLVRPFDPTKGDFQGGEGWESRFVDPAQWYPGYSGALSLLAAVGAGESLRSGVRPLTDDLYLNRLFVPWQLANAGLTIDSTAPELVAAATNQFGITADKLLAGALGRSRHKHTFENWMASDMLSRNILKPTDGDSMFAWAIACGLLHFGGLTGGVMESVIGAFAGKVTGCPMSFQFVSHDKLGEEKAAADLLDLRHRFGFSALEREKMAVSHLFDGEHLGSTLRLLGSTEDLTTLIGNAAYNERDIPGFEYAGFLGQLRVAKEKDPAARREFRFSPVNRQFLRKILDRQGWWDVRQVARLDDFAYGDDFLYAVTAITPNKWAPILGIQTDTNKITTETLCAGGSEAIYVLVVDSVAV